MSCNIYMYIVDLDYYPGIYFLCDNHIYYKAFITTPPVNIIISGFHTCVFLDRTKPLEILFLQYSCENEHEVTLIIRPWLNLCFLMTQKCKKIIIKKKKSKFKSFSPSLKTVFLIQSFSRCFYTHDVKKQQKKSSYKSL